MSNLNKLIIYTDGGSRGNPGPSAYGYVILSESNEIIHEEGKYLGINTNNFAEYTALIESLKKAHHLGAKIIEIRMDSELIVRQMTGVYKIKQPHLQELAKKCFEYLSKFTEYKFKHVRRELNKEADKQVNIALDEAEKKSH